MVLCAAELNDRLVRERRAADRGRSVEIEACGQQKARAKNKRQFFATCAAFYDPFDAIRAATFECCCEPSAISLNARDTTN